MTRNTMWALSALAGGALIITGAVVQAGNCGAKADKSGCDMKAACEAKAGCGAKSDCGAKSGCGAKADCASKKDCGAKSDCGACPVAGKATTAEGVLSAAALKSMMDAGTAVTLLDARSGKYDDGKRIPGAKALAPDANDEAISQAIASKDALVVTYCANTKCQASNKLATALREKGYKNVVELPVGIAGWEEAGFGVETAKN